MFTRRALIAGVAASAAAGAVTGIPSAPASEAAKRRLAEFYMSLGRVEMPRRYEIIREVWKLIFELSDADLSRALDELDGALGASPVPDAA